MKKSVQDMVSEGLMAVLEKATPRLLEFSLEQASQRPAAGKWSKKEILGHLIDSAANNHQRFVRAQYTNPLILPKYEQDQWVSLQAYQDSDWRFLVNLWADYNRHLAHVISRVGQEYLTVQCKIGPYEPATLEFIITDYLDHLKHHLKQLQVQI